MAGSERMTWFALFQAHQPLYVSDRAYDILLLFSSTVRCVLCCCLYLCVMDATIHKSFAILLGLIIAKSYGILRRYFD